MEVSPTRRLVGRTGQQSERPIFGGSVAIPDTSLVRRAGASSEPEILGGLEGLGEEYGGLGQPFGQEPTRPALDYVIATGTMGGRNHVGCGGAPA